MTEGQKHRQMNREALISLALYIFFFLWWYFSGYGLAKGSSEEYTKILGIPLWFFLSCILGWILMCLAVSLIVKKCFKDFDLSAQDDS